MALPLSFMEGSLTDSESEDEVSLTFSHNSSDNVKSRTPSTKLNARSNVVQAVIVKTNSFMVRTGMPQYVPQELLPTDAIFAYPPSSISQVFGIPLIARPLREEDDAKLALFLREAQVPNLQIRSLFRNCDVIMADPAAGPYDWDHEFGKCEVSFDGPVVLARLDGESLHPLHAQMILEYVEEQVEPLFEEYRVERKRWRKRMEVGEYRDKINEMRGNVEAMVKPSKMKAQWEVFKAEHQESCRGLPNPWDI